MTPDYLAQGPELLDHRFPLPLDRPFTTRMALEARVTPARLTALVRLGFVRRVLKGVYAAAQLGDTRELRARALALVVPPGSVVSDWTACWYWTGVDRPGSQDGVPRLSVFRFRGHERLRNSLVASGERWFLPSDVVPLDGAVGITTPLRTAWDLGRFSPRILAIGGMDALAATGAFTVPQLVHDVERFRRQRGVVRLRELAPLVDPRSESPGESALRLRWSDLSYLPRPEPQVRIGVAGGRVARLDLGVRRIRFGAEYDGEEWHTSAADRAHDRQRRELIKRCGWSLLVFRREDVFGVHETVSARLPAAVAEARRALISRAPEVG